MNMPPNWRNKRHAMHAEAITFHKGPLIIFRIFRLSDCSTKGALSWHDIRYTVYDARSNSVLKLLTPFVLKECTDFCLLNLIERIKYNLSLSFVLYNSPF